MQTFARFWVLTEMRHTCGLSLEIPIVSCEWYSVSMLTLVLPFWISTGWIIFGSILTDVEYIFFANYL